MNLIYKKKEGMHILKELMSVGILYYLYIFVLSKPQVISSNLLQITESLKSKAYVVRNNI